MPHISRQFLKNNVEQDLIQEMLDLISTKHTPARRRKITRELLTGVERLMLAKRLAIICMLAEGAPFEEIATTLKVSSSTVGRLWKQMQRGNFIETVKSVKQGKVHSRLTALIRALSIPRPRHTARWKFIDDL